MIIDVVRLSVSRVVPLLLAVLVVVGCGAPKGSDPEPVKVAGIVSWNGMGIEEAVVRAERVDGGGPSGDDAVAGRSGYHGAFVLELGPGRWRLTGSASVPQGAAEVRLRGVAEVVVPEGRGRLDRISLVVSPAP